MESERSAASPRTYQVPSVDRALGVIEALAHKPGASLSELTQQLRLPKNSIFRILATLTHQGYVLREADAKRYRLTSKLLGLAYAALDESGLVVKAWDVMNALRDETGETVLLGTLSENQGVVLEQAPGLHAIKVVVQVGHRFPLHSAAPGKAMVAFLPDERRARSIGEMKFVRFNANTIVTAEAYEQELAAVRSAGLAYDRGEEEEDIGCVAAPIFDRRGQACASLWITGPRSRLGKRRMLLLGRSVLQSASVVSQRIGFSAASLAAGSFANQRVGP